MVWFSSYEENSTWDRRKDSANIPLVRHHRRSRGVLKRMFSLRTTSQDSRDMQSGDSLSSIQCHLCDCVVDKSELELGATISRLPQQSCLHAACLRGTSHVSVRRASLECCRSELNNIRWLRHPSIILFMNVVMFSPTDVCLVFERISVGTLYNCIHERSLVFSTDTYCHFIVQICSALQYIHGYKYIHSAITSHAIFLTNLSTAKLGCLEHCQSLGSPVSVPADTHLLPWLAPELIFTCVDDTHTPCSAVSTCADIYSLCVVMWELVHARVPWSHLAPEDLLERLRMRPERLAINEQLCPAHIFQLLSVGLELTAIRRDLDLEEIVFMLLSGVVTDTPISPDCAPPPHKIAIPCGAVQQCDVSADDTLWEGVCVTNGQSLQQNVPNDPVTGPPTLSRQRSVVVEQKSNDGEQLAALVLPTKKYPLKPNIFQCSLKRPNFSQINEEQTSMYHLIDEFSSSLKAKTSTPMQKCVLLHKADTEPAQSRADLDQLKEYTVVEAQQDDVTIGSNKNESEEYSSSRGEETAVSAHYQQQFASRLAYFESICETNQSQSTQHSTHGGSGGRSHTLPADPANSSQGTDLGVHCQGHTQRDVHADEGERCGREQGEIVGMPLYADVTHSVSHSSRLQTPCVNERRPTNILVSTTTNSSGTTNNNMSSTLDGTTSSNPMIVMMASQTDTAQCDMVLADGGHQDEAEVAGDCVHSLECTSEEALRSVTEVEHTSLCSATLQQKQQHQVTRPCRREAVCCPAERTQVDTRLVEVTCHSGERVCLRSTAELRSGHCSVLCVRTDLRSGQSTSTEHSFPASPAAHSGDHVSRSNCVSTRLIY